MQTVKIQQMDVHEALEAYRDMKIELAPTLDTLKKLERKIKSHVLETGELIEIEGAKTAIRKGYTRMTWDGRALKGYAAAHPEILDFAKETNINSSVSIKLG